jgi:hypothetical protein
MDPDQHELELRAHVRHLLLDYAKTHLTKDYQSFTEDAVFQVSVFILTRFSKTDVIQLLSECLCFVPTTDPNSLTLPEDPFHTLSRILGFVDLVPFDEKWPADPDAIHILRKSLTFSGKPRTEKCWDYEHECMSSSRLV